MDVIKNIKEAWGWIGIDPVEVVGENDFGNLMIKDVRGRFWRLCPEELYCKIAAQNQEGMDNLWMDPEFLSDWQFQEMVDQAVEALGPLQEGHKYNLVVPPPVGGAYSIENLNIAPLMEMVQVSGELAEQLKKLPSGVPIEFSTDDDVEDEIEPESEVNANANAQGTDEEPVISED